MSRLAPEMEKRAKDLIGVYPKARSALIPLLHLAQEQNGHLTEASMQHIGELVGITAAEVLSVASFYDMFHTEPVGTYLLGVCTNIACMLNGGEELLHHLEDRLGVRSGETTSDGLFTIEEMECVAHCDKAPCMQVNYRYFGPLADADADALLDDLAAGRLRDVVPPHGTLVRVRRDGGLRADAETLAAERAAMQAKVDERAAAAKAKEEAAKAEAERAEAAAKAEAEAKAASAAPEDGAGAATAAEVTPGEAGEAAQSAERGRDAEAEAKDATDAAAPASNQTEPDAEKRTP